jgi:hypothetical protein
MKLTAPQNLPDADGIISEYTDASITLTINHQVGPNGEILDTASLTIMPARLDENGQVHHNSLFQRVLSFSFVDGVDQGNQVLNEERAKIGESITKILRNIGI